MTEAMDTTPDDVAVVGPGLLLPEEPTLVVPDGPEHAALDLAKLKCVEDETPEEHEAHAGELAAAYAAFAARSGAGQESNPAPPGETTEVDAHLTMDLE
jgi:hypothetical protein